MDADPLDQRSKRLRAQFTTAMDADGRHRPPSDGADGLDGSEPLQVVRSPRCVSFMGDQTDPADGLVLGAAIGPETWLAFRRRRDGLVRLAGERPRIDGEFWIDAVSADTSDLRVRPVASAIGHAADGATATDTDTSADAGPAEGAAADEAPEIVFAAGAAWSLREAGLPVRGLDGVIDSDDPGGGLGWSASVEMAAALALLGGVRVIDSSLLAALAHRADREYVGLGDGMAEHFLAAAGRAGRAVLLDCRSLESHHVTLPAGLRVVVSETGGPPRPAHVLADRMGECGRSMALLTERMPGLVSLRDLDVALLRRHRTALPEALALRTEHVVAENIRVMATAAALESGNLDDVSRLFGESNDSLRTLYEIGSPELDALVETADGVRGVVGSRMTGPRGTYAVSLVLADAVPALIAAIERDYSERTGLAGRAFEVAVLDGAGRLS
jgi:galactokinase